MDEAIYGTREIKNFWDAVGRGFISGAARSGIDYLPEALGPQKKARRSPIIPNPAATLSGGMRDPRSGCGVPSPFKNSFGYGSDYGYQYNVPITGSGSSQEDRKGFSLGNFYIRDGDGSDKRQCIQCSFLWRWQGTGGFEEEC
ncbi:MAG: hypothetical protein HDR71_08460 [Lachnospiraceae bacterium]|nr:hypothetical protein [Lachnospiraceae bacterium]